MALQNAINFIQHLEVDSALQTQVKTSDDAVRAGVALGLPFTRDEIRQAREQLYSHLSPEDLKKVAGGKVFA